MYEVKLAGCVITDRNDQVLLMHRLDHNQWELPGGRIEDGEVAIQAAAREAHLRIGIAVTALHHMGTIDFWQGEVGYNCELFRVTEFKGKPWIVEPHLYKEDIGYYNLRLRQIGRLSLSPNVEKLAREIQDERIRL